MEPRFESEDRSTRMTRAVSNITGMLGSFPAILLSGALIVAWLIRGLFVHDHFGNDTYQLLINTATTIVTFLMVFIIQNTQNRDGRAIQTKLDAQNEVLRVVANKLGIEDDSPELTRLTGLEDAPERDIKQEQERVRGQARNADNYRSS